MIPVPFTLDTGAPAYMYLCTTAIRHLDALGVIKEVSGHYLYQLMIDLLGPNKGLSSRVSGERACNIRRQRNPRCY